MLDERRCSQCDSPAYVMADGKALEYQGKPVCAFHSEMAARREEERELERLAREERRAK